MATSIIKTDEIRRLNDQVLMSDGALTGNVVFPAGHVVQVVPFQSNSATDNLTTSWTEIAASLVSITTKTENPLIIYNITMSLESDINSTGHGLWSQLMRSTVSPYTSFAVINTAKTINLGNYNGSFGYTAQSNITDYDYPVVSSGTRIDYKLRFIKDITSSVHINQQAISNEPSGTDNYTVGYVMEIQQ